MVNISVNRKQGELIDNQKLRTQTRSNNQCTISCLTNYPSGGKSVPYYLSAIKPEIAQLGERWSEDLKVPGSIPGFGIFFFYFTLVKIKHTLLLNAYFGADFLKVLEIIEDKDPTF
uniref:Uncharacterized protein n=1 Tax=Glossina palpalis gambiensis TaxID=67801 RepID=A0A1B0BLZ6_9MUSC